MRVIALEAMPKCIQYNLMRVFPHNSLISTTKQLMKYKNVYINTCTTDSYVKQWLNFKKEAVEEFFKNIFALFCSYIEETH